VVRAAGLREIIGKMATIDLDGPTATFVDEAGQVPW
jgi:hypothetical protein